jgi:hypothetical protein
VQQPEPDVEHALGAVLDKIDAFIRAGSPTGGNVTMYLAGGLAVHRYCETRHTNDIDASFSHRMLLPAKDMVAQFIGPRRGVQDSLPRPQLQHDLRADAPRF